jgi:hypothetical protein
VDVHEHQVEVFAGHEVDRLDPVEGAAGRVSLLLKQAAQGQGAGLIVLDDEYVHGRINRHGGISWLGIAVIYTEEKTEGTQKSMSDTKIMNEGVSCRKGTKADGTKKGSGFST